MNSTPQDLYPAGKEREGSLPDIYLPINAYGITAIPSCTHMTVFNLFPFKSPCLHYLELFFFFSNS